MLETKVTFNKGFKVFDLFFHRKAMRQAMERVGKDVQLAARALVSRRATSRSGQYPGRQTGVLRRSIRYRVSRPGFMVIIQPEKTQEMGKDFYPAFLRYGSRKRNFSARRDYMEDALKKKRNEVRKVIRRALRDAIKAARK